jgi:CRISPR-associated protein Csx14
VEVLNRQEDIAGIYRQLEPSRTQGPMSDSGILSLSPENFNSYKSRIRAALEKAFGSYEVETLVITSQGKRPDTRYGIPLERRRIKVIR